MTSPSAKSVLEHRRRQKRKGIVRVEVQVRQEDAALVRDVAHALSDPARRDGARALLRERVVAPQRRGLKALLAAAPLDDIDFDRKADFGRRLDL